MTEDSISRQAVDKIINDLLENDNLQASPSVWHGLHMIKQLPSAVVWCKDCQHLGEYVTEEKTYPNWCMINQQFVIHPENWFCKGGERGENG